MQALYGIFMNFAKDFPVLMRKMNRLFFFFLKHEAYQLVCRNIFPNA